MKDSEGGMKRLENLIELQFLNSNFSSSNFSIQAFRACPLIEIRQAAPCRAIRGDGISVNNTLPPLKDGCIGLAARFNRFYYHFNNLRFRHSQKQISDSDKYVVIISFQGEFWNVGRWKWLLDHPTQDGCIGRAARRQVTTSACRKANIGRN